VARLVVEIERIEARGRQDGLLERYRRLVVLSPRTAAYVLAYGELALPAGVPDARVSQARRGASEVHEAVTVVLAPPASHEPNVLRALRRLDARALAWAGRGSEAVSSAIGACGRLDDEGLELLRELAAWRIVDGDSAMAETALDSARRCAGHRPDATVDLAMLHLARGRTVDAVRLLREVYALDTTNSARRHDLAAALAASGTYDEALGLLSPPCEAEPTRVCLVELAAVSLEARRFEAAAAYARRAEPLAPAPDAEPAYLLGSALAATGQRRGAREAFARALERAPNDLRIRRALEALEREPEAR
jgi:Flp pilus assembly protein TadD